MRRLLLLAGLAAPLFAQPAIFPKGIVNPANYLPPGLPEGAIAQGSIFSIFGTALGPPQGMQQPSFPLQNALGGVSITVTQGATVVNAIPIYVAAGLVNAIMPSNTPLGMVSVTLTFNSQASNPAPVRVVVSSPGIFTAAGTGIGPGSAQNISGNVAQLNSPLHPGQPGQFIVLWLTGLGPIAGADANAPPVGTLPFPIEVFVGGELVSNVTYSGRSPCCAGVDQIDFQLPADAIAGCYVPVVVRVSGAAVSTSVTMAIKKGAGACSDPSNPLSTVPVNGGNLGIVALHRDARLDTVNFLGGIAVTSDQGQAWFGQYTSGEFNFDPYIDLPPPGACTTYGSAGNPELNLGRTTGKDLSPGTISIAGPSGNMSLANYTDDFTWQFSLLGLDTALPGYPASPLYLNNGAYTVRATGGDIGTFIANLNVAAPIAWSNANSFSPVVRTQPLTLTWTGTGTVIIRGTNRDYATNSTGTFICWAPPGANSFVVPTWALEALPANRTLLTDFEGYIELHSVMPGSPVPIVANNLAAGIALADFTVRRAAIFQ